MGNTRSPAAEMSDPTMTNKFITILDSIGSKFKIGVAKAIAVEKKVMTFETAALPVEQEIAAGVAIVNPAVGATLEDFLSVVGGVQQVATAVGAATGTGDQKLQAALPGVENVIFSDPLFAGKKPADLDKFNGAIAKFASALVDIFNSFEAAVESAAAASATAIVPASQIPVKV